MGPPGSGKSTWAKEQAKSKGVIRINRDDLRTMFKGGYVHGVGFVEKLCTEVTYEAALITLRNGWDVVLDNTNCNLKTVKEILSNIQGSTQVVFKVFDIPYWKQRYRCIMRWVKGGIWIPSEVSKRMHNNFLEVKEWLKDKSYELC